MEECQEDPLIASYDPFQHPLVWCLQDFLQQQEAISAGAGGVQDTFVCNQQVQAALKVGIMPSIY